MIEKDIENHFKKHLKKYNIYYIKNHGSIFNKVGIPDLIFCYNSHFIAVEFKKLPNKLTQIQKINLTHIYNNNGIILEVNDKNYKEIINLFNPTSNDEIKNENWKKIIQISTKLYNSFIR